MATGATISTTSVSGLGLTGLSSGLDTSGIITKLMAIESAPQTQLKSQLTTLQTHTNALQALNTAVAGVASTAKAALTANALTSFTTSSSSTAATATASAGASAGSVSFTVDRLAAAQVTVTDAMTRWDTATTPSITIRTNANGSSPTDTTLTFASSNLDDVVAAINGKGLGITATKVAAGTDGTGAVQYRLQLRSATGAANAFSVSPGTSSSSSTLGTTITSAADAQLTLYAGTGAEQRVTSASNTFSNLMTGLDIAVSATSSGPVTVDVAPDVTAASTSAQALTTGLIAVFAGIASSTAITTSSSTSGGTSTSSTSGGVLTGDSLVRLVKDSLLSAVTGAVDGRSPSSIGINLTKDGTITFDQSAFEAAMKSDPAGTTAMYTSIATAVSKVASSASDQYTGSLTQKVTSEQGQQSDVTSKISDWDSRLATIQAQYTLQFNNLETALNSLSSQSNYLTSQISGLTTNYQSK